MRLAATTLLAALALAAAHAVPFPDTTPGESVPPGELRLQWDRDAASIFLLDRTGQAEEATRLHAALWAARDSELAARQIRAADLSLAALNPWLTPAERTAATTALERTAADLAELSTFAMPDPATRDQFLARAGRPVSDSDRTRAKLHLLLQKMRQSAQIAQLQNRPLFERRRAVLENLEALAGSGQSLERAVVDAKDLPLASDALRSLAGNFEDAGAARMFIAATGDSSAFEATLTRLLLSHPASANLWAARSLARFAQGWRAGAVRDLAIALQLEPGSPAAASLRAEIAAAPALPAALWQEPVDPEAVRAALAFRASPSGATAPALPAELERVARAALRNRARRLYTCAFISDPAERAAALRWVLQQNPAPPGLMPRLDPALGTQFPQDVAAAGTDARAVFAVHHRYAPLYAGTEQFWQAHASLCARAGQLPAALAALDVAAALAPRAAWIASFRAQIAQRLKAAAP